MQTGTVSVQTTFLCVDGCSNANFTVDAVGGGSLATVPEPSTMLLFLSLGPTRLR